MSEFTPIIGRKIKFLAPQTRTGANGSVEFRQFESTGTVVLEVPERREVQIDKEFYRFEDVTVLEVEGQPAADFLNGLRAANAPDAPALAPPPPPLVRWNPITKTVLNHETGQIDTEATNAQRALNGLPVPWTPEIGKREFSQPPVQAVPTPAAPAPAPAAANLKSQI